MNKILKVEPDQFANIRKAAMEDEVRGIDPGVSWAAMYPGVTELEFVVVPPQPTPDEVIERLRARIQHTL
jgi:hypothetical protein